VTSDALRSIVTRPQPHNRYHRTRGRLCADAGYNSVPARSTLPRRLTAIMEFDLWKVLILAVVQGIGEFLPISSSGHVVVVAALLKSSKENLDVADLNIVLHLGTLLSILVFYWRRILDLLSKDRQVIGWIVLGTIPAVIIGLPLKKLFGWVLSDPLVAGCMFPVTGVVLLLASRHSEGKTDYRQMSWKQALLIGCAQAAAIMPGLSRSGSTISAALGLGLKRESAATFSFLLAIAAIAGAGVLEGIDILHAIQENAYHPSATPLNMLIGAGVAFVVGLASLWVLVRLLERGRLTVFAWYCIALGVAAIGWQLSLRLQ
jgi:undecaprenyl-diphosphatase